MTRSAVIHLLNEFSPVLVFFIAGRFYDFFTATALLLGFTCISLVVGWTLERRLAVMPLLTSLFVLVPGFFTLQMHNPDILIFGDTVFYFLMAAVVGGGLMFDYLVLKKIFEPTFAMSDVGWHILSQRWTLVFILAGIGNEIIRVYFSPDVWVDYKFAKVILISVFGFWQFRLARLYRLPKISNAWGLRL